MNKSEIIRKLIKATIHRAIRESAACLLVIIAFAYHLQHLSVGSAKYYGCLLILISAGFIAGVIWAFTLSYTLLRTHPASDSAFWHEAFLAQARLLRLVPLWYLAPLCSGMLLFFAPTAPGEFATFLANFIVVALLFGGTTWLNKHAAAKIEKDAQAIAA